MNDLLAFALEAHGGLEQWRKFTQLEADLSITGAIWTFKGQPDVLKSIYLQASTQTQRVLIRPLGQSGLGSVMEQGHLSLVDAHGAIAEQLASPLSAFAGHTAESQWGLVHVAYFSSYAVWGYLTSPFLYTSPGFTTQEIAPWQESGETWRRLQINFPQHLARHCPQQVSYFGPDGLLRRHDYQVEILGGATGANYAYDYEDFAGIKVATRRRIHAYDAEGQKVEQPLLVSIDVKRLSFT